MPFGHKSGLRMNQANELTVKKTKQKTTTTTFVRFLLQLCMCSVLYLTYAFSSLVQAKKRLCYVLHL